MNTVTKPAAGLPADEAARLARPLPGGFVASGDELERATPAGRHRGAARALLEDLPVRKVVPDGRPLARSYDEFLAAGNGTMQLAHSLREQAMERARLFVSDVTAYQGDEPTFAAMAKNLNDSPSKHLDGSPLR